LNGGYVRLWRKSIESGWLKNPNLWVFWCWCLMKASHKERDVVIGFQQVHLMPGDFIFGRKKASEELAMSEQTIRTCIETLKKLKNLTIKVTNKYSVVSIVNWSIYQDEEIGINQQINQQLTNNQPTTNHKQECKALKNKTIAQMFQIFWEAYPKKKSIGQAEKAFAKTQPDEQLMEKIIHAIERAKTSGEWQKENGQFIPYPATWLNAKGWMDEANTEVSVKPDLPRALTPEEEWAQIQENLKKQEVVNA
jgi:hypothetical protein